MKPFYNTSPIVIGGIGGSGTRVIADILMHAGIYLGNNLNHSLDNLLFTVLLKRIELFEKDKKQRELDVNTALDVFTRAMTNSSTWNNSEKTNIYNYVRDISKEPDTSNNIRGFFNSPQELIENILSPESVDLSNYAGWGWKEPNSHILLEHLIQFFCDMKYIHVTRHGLDMAYSDNQNQVNTWGSLYGIKNNGETHDPATSFQYWLKANLRATNVAKDLLAERLLIVQFENLCHHPENEIDRIVDFLGIPVSSSIRGKIIDIPSAPLSIGRYKEHNTSWLTEEDIVALNDFGYKYQP